MKSDDLCEICRSEDTKIVKLLNDSKSQIKKMQKEVDKIQFWLENETIFELSFYEDAFLVDFEYIINQLKENNKEYRYFFHFSAILEILQSLHKKIQIHDILNQIQYINDHRSLIFLGEPGTGKTHGAAAETEQLLKDEYHIPILIQARDVPPTHSWKEIIISSLRLEDSWSEAEIWQGLSSLAHRRKIHILEKYGKVSVLPKIVIFVDGIDESTSYVKWIERVRETKVIVENYPVVRFCFMSRPHVFRQIHTDGRIVNINIVGDVPTYKLFDLYTKYYNIDISCAGWIKYALTTPLALKLFCELNKGRKIIYYSGMDVSISTLLKEKIAILEQEYCKQDLNATVTDQYVLKSIALLADLFSSEQSIIRTRVHSILEQKLSISNDRAKKLAEYLENYGILYLSCQQGKSLFSPNEYFYNPGIQGYFDYASAFMLLDKYVEPQKIDFQKHVYLSSNTYYILAIISVQNFDYLIINNNSIDIVIDDLFKEELLFLALRHTKPEQAQHYKPKILSLMQDSAETLRKITNNIILPLSRVFDHPLSAGLINEFLLGFNYPAQRDIIWSVPINLKSTHGEIWYTNIELELEQEAYSLTTIDIAEGLPTIYAWALSSVNNIKRKKYRGELIKWAFQVPNEFYKLFLLFSILMSLLFENENIDLLKQTTNWLIKNILSTEKIDDNRDIAIRHYAISIIHKALSLGIIEKETAKKYLPPFKLVSNYIALSEEALKGTYMGGYSGISYDLGRYVLIDHLAGSFPDYQERVKEQYEELIANIAKEQPQYSGIAFYQFILSAAYKFIQMCGWEEDGFCDIKNKDGIVYGVDSAIAYSYLPKTHGAQSTIMTICEKYIWQARYYISGFLADHLMYVDEKNSFYINDYNLLDNFLIPAMEVKQIDPQNMYDLYPWHIPEEDIVMISKKSYSVEDVTKVVTTAPDIKWEKWIQLDNTEHKYPINEDSLIALSGFSCFESDSGMETNLYFTSILIPENEMSNFVEQVIHNSDISNYIVNPPDWKGGIYANCYITPKEICWMPWKARYDSWLVDKFPTVNIQTAVDRCTDTTLEYDDVGYDMPSVIVREMLEIRNTNGYEFYGKDKQIEAINVFAGKKWHTSQQQLLVRGSLLHLMCKSGKSLVWIMREHRKETAAAREKFGDFYVNKDNSYIGFFKNNTFSIERIPHR